MGIKDIKILKYFMSQWRHRDAISDADMEIVVGQLPEEFDGVTHLLIDDELIILPLNRNVALGGKG